MSAKATLLMFSIIVLFLFASVCALRKGSVCNQNEKPQILKNKLVTYLTKYMIDKNCICNTKRDKLTHILKDILHFHASTSYILVEDTFEEHPKIMLFTDYVYARTYNIAMNQQTRESVKNIFKEINLFKEMRFMLIGSTQFLVRRLHQMRRPVP